MYNQSEVITFIENFMMTCEQRMLDAEEDRDDCNLNGMAYARHTGLIEDYNTFILPNLQIAKDLILTLQDLYLKKCKELNILPSDDEPLGNEDLIFHPTDDEICTCPDCNPDNKIEYEDDDEE